VHGPGDGLRIELHELELLCEFVGEGGD
jgi:hypothetical protein